ncbi:hypothetical protein [Streptomyces sp. NPDC002962]|uniref:hypothetical protein n=1 Tax=Streptomyces sp. NPDC002962 TaxID=3364674 RepID=UPI00368FA897
MLRFEEALDAHKEYLVSCRELGDRECEGIAYASLGLALATDAAKARHQHAVSHADDRPALLTRRGECSAAGEG